MNTEFLKSDSTPSSAGREAPVAPAVLSASLFVPVPETVSALPDLSLPAGFPAVLDAAQMEAVRVALQDFSLARLPLGEIARLGAEAEMALHQTLGRFLNRIEQHRQPRIFRLVDELQQAVEREALPALAERILHGKPGLMERLRGALHPRSLRGAADRAFEEVRGLLAAKSRTLSERIAAMEQELRQEQAHLETEIRALEALKEQYRQHFVAFAQASLFLGHLLAQARQELAQAEAAPQADPMALQELRDKLQALESRALAVEGTMSRLPADQVVIRQLQTAGIATLQETGTSAAARFASIRMTLLTIHGALATQGVQRLAQQGAELDRNLQEVRSRLLREVAGQAAAAPGDNRLAQARQLGAIVEDTRALVALAEQARADNARKFEEARQLFARARADLAQAGAAVRPDRALSL